MLRYLILGNPERLHQFTHATTAFLMRKEDKQAEAFMIPKRSERLRPIVHLIPHMQVLAYNTCAHARRQLGHNREQKQCLRSEQKSIFVYPLPLDQSAEQALRL